MFQRTWLAKRLTIYPEGIIRGDHPRGDSLHFAAWGVFCGADIMTMVVMTLWRYDGDDHHRHHHHHHHDHHHHHHDHHHHHHDHHHHHHNHHGCIPVADYVLTAAKPQGTSSSRCSPCLPCCFNVSTLVSDSHTTNVCLNREPIADQSRCRI